MRRAKPNSVGVREAKTRFFELLDHAARGQETTITRHGSPVARLVPVRSRMTSRNRRAAIRRWLRSSKGITLGKLKLRDLIESGRA